jgi:hypothetical protein
MITDEDLDARLWRIDPARSFPELNGEVSRLVEDHLTRSRTAPRRRLKRRGIIGIGVLAALLIGGVPAAAGASNLYKALSNWYPAAGGEVLRNSPWVDTSKSDFPALAESIYPSWLPLPSAVSPTTIERSTVKTFTDNPGLTQEITIEGGFERAAYCTWVGDWLANDTKGNIPARQTAAMTMIAAAKWPGTVAANGGHPDVVKQGLGAKALSGDRSAVQLEAQLEVCPAWDGIQRNLP